MLCWWRIPFNITTLFSFFFILLVRRDRHVQKMSKPKSGKKVVKKLNYDLGGGLLKYSRSKQYQRKGLWRFAGKKRPVVKKQTKPITVVKKVNGAKNGGERVVNLLKPKSNYPTKARVTKRPTRGLFKNHTRNTRKSLKPGRILILLAGRHKGKRVVFLKVSVEKFST